MFVTEWFFVFFLKLKYQMRIFDDEPEVCEDIFKEEEETEEKLPGEWQQNLITFLGQS